VDNSDNAGCDKCGTFDRVDGSKFCEGCMAIRTIELHNAENQRLAMGKSENVVIEKANILLVGDRVNLFADQPGAAFGWGTVVCVTEDEAEIHRPYIHTSDFTGAAGFGVIGERLISYIGQEITKLDRRSDRTYSVVFRTTVPK
jgi:hypothetical protein